MVIASKAGPLEILTPYWDRLRGRCLPVMWVTAPQALWWPSSHSSLSAAHLIATVRASQHMNSCRKQSFMNWLRPRTETQHKRSQSDRETCSEKAFVFLTELSWQTRPLRRGCAQTVKLFDVQKGNPCLHDEALCIGDARSPYILQLLHDFNGAWWWHYHNNGQRERKVCL